MLQLNKPEISVQPPTRFRTHGFSAPQVAVLFAAFTLLISIPIWTHPLPPLSDYVNHLARMHVIATLSKNPQLARFYELDWDVIPNLTMDLIVPVLARFMNVYVAGQVFIVSMFALIISGVLALNRALIGRWSVFPLVAFPLVYNYVFLVGLMNYMFGIGVALWALAAGSLCASAPGPCGSFCRPYVWWRCSSAISRRSGSTALDCSRSRFRGCGSSD